MVAREGPLTRAFVRLIDTLVADYDTMDLCQQLVDDCVELLSASAAGLLLSDSTSLRVLAASSEQTRLMELFQLQADAGPCLDAYRTGTRIVVDDLTEQASRWPVFGHRMLAEGFRAVYAVPLRLREQRIGALNLFCEQPGALRPADVSVGQALADVATIGILHQRVVARQAIVNEQLQTALNNRIIIEQAKGVLAERSGLDTAQAFATLRAYARSTSTRLAVLARAIVEGSFDTTALLRTSAPDGAPQQHPAG
ncbi:GAF and ANTAR domain-containing protein [Nocardia sp. alder85J]|uniref:GAF and ANTAR domain-containing protein n=1 Tax=Nocardia sp. alder85J TaxID=2862949 RepID=UPI001CD75B8C|nr:GAF and ANTAR domain-containing protein [Nocardia sp. alder85J]MCX4093895.1 GAF and ANTAR domain-containing protein [Nocardia sp. alder85J]